MSQKTSIILLNNGENVISSDIHEIDCITLPHPKEQIPVLFLQLDGELYEFQSIEPQKYGSWFVDQRMISDKKMYFGNKFDERFLVLPYLEKTSEQPKFSPLDQTVTATQGCARIPLQNASKWKMEEMCDVKDLGDDMVFYRYNETKALQWLNAKVAKIASVLSVQRKERSQRDQSLFVSGFDAGTSASDKQNAPTPTAVEVMEVSSPGADVSGEDTRIAVQILTDYLTKSMTDKLLASQGFTAQEMQAPKKQDQKRKQAWELELELEKDTMAHTLPTMGSTAASSGSGQKANPLAKKPTQRPNAASRFNGGKPVEASRSIAAFFGKK